MVQERYAELIVEYVERVEQMFHWNAIRELVDTKGVAFLGTEQTLAPSGGLTFAVFPEIYSGAPSEQEMVDGAFWEALGLAAEKRGLGLYCEQSRVLIRRSA